MLDSRSFNFEFAPNSKTSLDRFLEAEEENNIIFEFAQTGNLAGLQAIFDELKGEALQKKLAIRASNGDTLIYAAIEDEKNIDSLRYLVKKMRENNIDPHIRNTLENCPQPMVLAYNEYKNKIVSSFLELDQLMHKTLKSANPLLDLLAMFPNYKLPANGVKLQIVALLHLDYIYDHIKTLIQKNPTLINIPDKHGRTSVFYLIDFPEQLNNFALKLAEYFLDQGASLIVADNKSTRCDFYATSKYKYQFIELFCKKNKERNIPWNINFQDSNGITLLYKIVTELNFRYENDGIRLIQILLENKADPNLFPANDLPMLCKSSIWPSRQDIFPLLAQSRIDPDQCDSVGNNFFHVSAQRNQLDCLNLFKSKDINARNKEGETPLLISLKKFDDKQNVKSWIALGADPNIPDSKGNTPLMAAVLAGHPDVCDYLVEQKADVKRINKDNESIVHFALKSRLPEVFIWIIKNFPHKTLKETIECQQGMQLLLNCINNNTWTSEQKLKTLLALIEVDIHINFPCPTTTNLIATMMCLGHCQDNVKLGNQILLKTVAKGLLINNPNESGETILHLALKGKHKGALSSVAILLECKANPNKPNNEGITPLMHASWTNDLALTVLLLKHNANINASTPRRETALSYALKGNQLFVADYLVDQKASVDTILADQETLLHRCIKLFACKQYIRLLTRLLTLLSPDSVNARNHQGSTTLMLLASSEFKEHEFKTVQQGLKLLFEHKADPNITDNQGHNAIALMALQPFQPSRAIVDLLVKHNANCHLADERNKRPLAHALTKNHIALADYIFDQPETQEYINQIDNEGSHLLHYVCEHVKKEKDLSRMLTRWQPGAEGFNLNVTNAVNNSPLRLVLWRAMCNVTWTEVKWSTGKNPSSLFRESIAWLLKQGANPNEAVGDLPLCDYVINIDDPSLLQTFREHKMEHKEMLLFAAKRDAFDSIPLIAGWVKGSDHWQTSLDTCLSIMLEKLSYCGNKQLTMDMVRKYYNLRRYNMDLKKKLFIELGRMLTAYYSNTIDFFLKSGANPEQVEAGITLLMKLMQHHDYEAVFEIAKKLIEHSKDKVAFVNRTDNEGRNALIYLMQSVKNNFSPEENYYYMLNEVALIKVLELLIEHKIDVNHVTTSRQSALMHAAKWTKCGTTARSVMMKLLEAKADINLKDQDNNTVLTTAAQSCLSVVTFLIDRNADIRQINSKGRDTLSEMIKATAESKSLSYYFEPHLAPTIQYLLSLDPTLIERKEVDARSTQNDIRNLSKNANYDKAFALHKLSFLSGLHRRSESSLRTSFRESQYFDRNLLKTLFHFAGWSQSDPNEEPLSLDPVPLKRASGKPD